MLLFFSYLIQNSAKKFDFPVQLFDLVVFYFVLFIFYTKN